MEDNKQMNELKKYFFDRPTVRSLSTKELVPRANNKVLSLGGL